MEKRLARPISFIVFWYYNLLYVGFVAIALLHIFILFSSSMDTKPTLGELLTLGGAIPTNMLVMIYGIFLTPLVTIGLGVVSIIKKREQDLIKLFFGFEIPVMGLMLTRLVFLRQVTPFIWLLFFGIVLSVIGLLIHLFKPKHESKTKLTLLMLSQQIALIVAAYAFLLIFFFLPILAAFLFKDLLGMKYMLSSLFEALLRDEILEFLFQLFFALILFSTAFFFLLGPIGAAVTFWANWRELYTKLVHKAGAHFASITRWGISALYILLAIFLALPANTNKYTSLISSYKKASSFEAKQQIAGQIMKRDREIRNGLTATYLAQYRYLSDRNMNLLTQGYKNELLFKEATAKSIQHAFNTIALPFMYRGAFEEDIKQASENYRDLFDAPIQKGELTTIAKTLEAANTRDSLKAGILDSAKQTVRLVERTIQVTPHNEGLLATVTIEEEYKNTSREQQEVYYEFSLPDNAVITELTLGPDLEIGANAADKPMPTPAPNPTLSPNQPTSVTTPPQVDTAIVAPKGAADATFDQQIFRRSDPALLVQIGPRQYKLRVFPIPVESRPIDIVPPQKNQKVRYSYVTLVNAQGVPLPAIGEKRNVFEDKNTKILYTIEGQSLTPPKLNEGFVRLPRPMPCLTHTVETQTVVGTVAFIPHSSNPYLSSFFSCTDGFAKTDTTIQSLRIAILLDTSYSMEKLNWNAYLKNAFPIESLIKSNTVDLYFFNNTISQKYPLTIQSLNKPLNIVPLGKTDRVSAIASVPSGYNLILMMTDGSIFDDKAEGKTLPTHAPIYLVHPNGIIPPYNDALANGVIQSNGKVLETGSAAIQHLWQQQQVGPLEQLGTILDTNEQGTWILLKKRHTSSFLSSVPKETVDAKSPLGVLAQKRLIMDSIRQAGQSVGSVEFLDTINRLSEQSFIVTPYSSMIVLVNDFQREQLAQAMKQNNRYQLNLDVGEEQLGNPSGQGILAVGAVPEPHEWLLIIVGTGLLLYLYRSHIGAFLKPLYAHSSQRTTH